MVGAGCQIRHCNGYWVWHSGDYSGDLPAGVIGLPVYMLGEGDLTGKNSSEKARPYKHISAASIGYGLLHNRSGIGL